MYRAAYPCDLHTHTTRSDGKDSPRALIDNAVSAGIKILAITDHDIIAPNTILVDGAEMPLAEYAELKGIVVLPGIEFSCDTDVEDVHIIALGCDWRDPFFQREYENSIQSKVEGYHKLCDLLKEQEMHVSWEEDILLDGQRSEKQVQRKYIFEAMARKGYAEDWSKAKLLVKNTPALSVKRHKPHPADIIEGIHKAGGFAILAHPYLITESPVQECGTFVTRTAYIDSLIDAGLDGIEACYPYNKTSYNGTLTPQQIEDEVRNRYGQRLDVLSGGSDYHAEEKAGISAARRLGEKGVYLEYFESNPLLSDLVERQKIYL